MKVTDTFDRCSLCLDLLERMILIRRAEEKLSILSKAGKLPGAVHLCIGQEAATVGACAALNETDWITSTHRGHGHFLAKGGALKKMYAEIWGKREGICQGMGGSMHVADFTKGILGANGIVGGGFAIATGAALGAKLRKDRRVALCFFGDGAANQGVFMESMNISAIWALPTIFFCENNGLSEFTVTSTVTGGRLVDRASAFMPAVVVDGNDVLEVRNAVVEATDRARRGEGPSYIEAVTYRINGHLESEEAFLGGGRYRAADEILSWRSATKDPIQRFQTYLLTAKLATEEHFSQIEHRVAETVSQAVDYAESGQDADTELALSLMFVAGGA